MNLLIVNDAVVEVQTMQDNIPWPAYGIERVYTAFCVEDARDTIRKNLLMSCCAILKCPAKTALP